MTTLERYLVSDVKTLAASAPAADAAALLALANVHDVLVVDDDGRLAGQVSVVPEAAGSVRDALEPVPSVVVDADAGETLERMQREGLRRLAVVDGAGRPVGILPRARLERRYDHDRRRTSP